MQLMPLPHRYVAFCAVFVIATTLAGCATVKQNLCGAPSSTTGHNTAESTSQACVDVPEEPEVEQADASKVQAHDEPQAITSEEIRFVSKGVELVGVVDRPQATGEPLPAVVMLHDAGPMDRRGLFHGAFGLELPVEVAVYEELAENLAQNGYLVLRFDKRTCVDGGPPWCSYPRAYVEDHREALADALMADAKAAVEAVRKQKDVDPTRVFLLGHGQGAEIALAIAKDVGPSGFVLLSPSPYPLDEVIMHQTKSSLAHLQKRRKAEANTTMGTLIQEQIDALEAARKSQRQAFQQLRAGTVGQHDVLGAPTKTWTAMFDLHDRAMAGAKSTKVPLLALFGEHDLSLPADSAEKFQKTLAPSPNSEVMRLPGITHPMVALDSEDHSATTQVSEDVHQAILHFFDRLQAAQSPRSPGS